MPHHPESTDIKQQLETAFIQEEGHPNIALLTGGLQKNDSCRNCTVEVQFPGAGTIY